MGGPALKQSVFRSAIAGDDGTVDPGYLALYCVMAATVGSIPIMCLLALTAMLLHKDHIFDAQGLGVAIGAACTGAGVVIGAVGAFRMGDKPHANTLTTSSVNTKTEVTAPP